jgi:DNA primase
MIGCALPEWLPEVLAFKRVLIASDADEAGDKAAADWIEKLQAVGCRCARLKPYQAKDWNEMHERAGTRKIAAYLSARLAHIRHFEWLEK